MSGTWYFLYTHVLIVLVWNKNCKWLCLNRYNFVVLDLASRGSHINTNVLRSICLCPETIQIFFYTQMLFSFVYYTLHTHQDHTDMGNECICITYVHVIKSWIAVYIAHSPFPLPLCKRSTLLHMYWKYL